eukprot:11050425-Alexandrium_andersonii.AAC.1
MAPSLPPRPGHHLHHLHPPPALAACAQTALRPKVASSRPPPRSTRQALLRRGRLLLRLEHRVRGLCAVFNEPTRSCTD